MPLSRPTSPKVELESLAELFFGRLQDLGKFVEVTADEVPAPWKQLLAHEDHMTVRVEDHYRSPVDVEVLEHQCDDTSYSRKILLKLASDGRIVQFGLVRVARAALEESIMKKIEAGNVPLGRILIDHNVLRKVRLSRLWRIEPGAELSKVFGEPDRKTCYGRTAVIDANGRHAIELLEIVA
jgi:chorismate-pyruvate lyase